MQCPNLYGDSYKEETSFSVMQAKLLSQHYHQLCQSERWRSLPKGVKPLRFFTANCLHLRSLKGF
jgi:hypothetical protein